MGLVETDMAVGADAQQLQVQPAQGPDGLGVGAAGGVAVFGHAVGQVHLLTGEPQPVEQVLAHEVAVALGMRRRQAHILIQVEGPHCQASWSVSGC